MPKLIFRVNADTSPVKKFRTEIEQIEKTMLRIKGENFSFDHWVKEFERLKTELEKKREQIDNIKKDILSVNPIMDRKKFDSLNTELSKSSKERDTLIDNTIALSNKFGKAYDNLVATLGKAQKVTDEVTARFIEQKQVVANLQSEVRSLNAEYRNADKGNKVDIRSQITSKQKELEQQRVTLNALKAEQERAKLAVKGLSDETRNYEKVVGKVSGAQSEANLFMGRFEQTLLKIGGLATLRRFASDVIRVRGEFQKTQMSFETMLGSKEKADKLMSQMVETAAKTPFDLQGVADGAKQLLAYGTEAKDVNDTLIRLGNIASGLSIPLGDMVYLYGTTQTQGRLFTQDVRQFMGRGIPLVKELAAMLGKTEEEINKMVTAGQIGFPEVEKVIKKMTDEGGKFYNLMEKQSETLSGQISNFGDAWDRMLNSIGEDTQGLTSNTISMVTAVVENYETVGKILFGLIATYGTYRTAVMLVTAAEGKHTLVEIGLTNVRVMARKAQLALNAAMLTNPYVLLATAVFGLGAAIWVLHDATSTQEKEMARVNERTETYNKYLSDEKKHVDSLISVIKDENAAKKDRIEALNELQSKYPHFFGQYKTEKELIEHLTEALKEYNEQQRIRKELMEVKNNKDDITRLNELRRLQELQKVGASGRTKQEQTEWINLYSKYKKISGKASFGSSEIQDMIDALSDTVAKGQANIRKQEQTAWEATLDTMDKTTAEGYKKMLEGYKIILRDSGKEWIKMQGSEAPVNAEMLTTRIKQLDDKILNVEWKDAETYRKEAKAAWEKAKKEVEGVKSSSISYKSEADYQKVLKEKLDAESAAEKRYKDLGGVTDTSKQENQADKLREETEKYNLLLDKQGLERQRQQEDIENQVTQSIIEAKSDGFDKIQAQRELDNKKEIQSLKRQKEDMIRAIIQAEKEKFDAEERIKAQQVKGYKIKGFDVSSVDTSKISSSWDAIIKNAETKQGLNEWEQREASMNEYLLKYGTFSQKKEAIDKKYLDAIEKETDLGKKNTLQKEWDEALANLDLNKLKQEINWEMVFGDLSKVTKDQLSKIKKQLQEFKQSDEFKNATPEQIQVIEGAINSINDAMVDKGGFFGGMVDSVTELKKATEELKKAEEELTEANKNGTEAQKEEAQKKVNQARNRQQNAETNVTKSSEKTIQHLTDVGNAIAQLGSDSEMSLSQFGNAAGSIVDAFTEAGSKIGGLVGAIFSVLEGIQKQGLDGFVGNVLGNVAGAVGGILDTITFGAFGFRGADYSGYQKMKDQYDNLNAIWDELIDKKKEYIEMSYGAEANKVGREALELAEKSIESYRILGRERLNSGASMGSHSIGKRMVKNTSVSDWQDIANAIGMSLNDAKDFIGTGRMTGLFDLTAEQLEKLKGEAPTFWAKMDSDVRDYLNSIIEGSERIENIQNQVKEQLTQVSFDSVFDSFVDTLMDMDSSAENFADNFEKYMQRAVLTTMVGDKYKAKLQAWYDSFAKANDDEAGITKEEMDKSQKEWDAIVAEAVAERDKLKDLFGWTGDASSSQSATRGEYQTLSEDTGKALEGRATALQMAGEEIKNQSIQQTGLLSSINEKISLLNLTNEDIPRLAANVPDIAGQSQNSLAGGYQSHITINFPTEEIESLADDVSTLKGVVDEMRTLQIEKFADFAEGVAKIAKNTPVMNTKLDSINNNIKKAL